MIRNERSERRVTVNGLQMVYQEAGSRDGKPLVYVHGNTGGKIWFDQVMEIPDYRTIALDMPNFGNSDRLDVADIDVYADYVASFLRELNLSESYVVGHSLGGAVCISLTVRYPELVGRLMLVDSSALEGLHTPEEYYPVIEQYKTNRDLMKQALQAVTPTLNDDSTLDALTDNALKMNPIAFAGNARALDRFNYVGKGSSVSIPVLVVRGEMDALITDEMAKSTAEAFPHGRLKSLEGVGHSVMVEAPERFMQLVQGFGVN